MTGTPGHEAEVSLLGSILLNNEALGRCADVIDAASLLDPRHRLIWAAMCRLDAKGQAIDAVTVGSELEASGDGAEVRAGGFGYLLDLSMASATSVNVEAHAVVVADGSKRRSLHAAAEGIARHAADTSQTVGEALTAADGLLAALLDAPGRGEVVQTQRESSLAMMARLRDVSEGKSPPKIPFGFNLSTLTNSTGGGADPACELIAIAARSGVGKTALGDQLADEIGRLGLGVVLYFSVEVSGAKLEGRRLSRRTGISMQRVAEWHTLNAGEVDRVFHSASVTQSQAGGVVTFFKAGLDTAYIGRKVRQWCRRGKVAAVVLDYWQALRSTPGERYNNRNDELGAIAAALKAVQIESGVAMYVLAQLNRGPANRPGGRPVETDIRESDWLAFWASVIVLVHRPAYTQHELKQDDGTEDAELIVCKNREGPVGPVEVLHRPDTGRFWMQADGWQSTCKGAK